MRRCSALCFRAPAILPKGFLGFLAPDLALRGWKAGQHFEVAFGHARARAALTRLTDTLALSSVPELKTLRTTLMRWRREALSYFLCRLTNGRVEGFNGKAKLVIRRAYGYKSFRNYRLRLLSCCA